MDGGEEASGHGGSATEKQGETTTAGATAEASSPCCHIWRRPQETSPRHYGSVGMISSILLVWCLFFYLFVVRQRIQKFLTEFGHVPRCGRLVVVHICLYPLQARKIPSHRHSPPLWNPSNRKVTFWSPSRKLPLNSCLNISVSVALYFFSFLFGHNGIFDEGRSKGCSIL